MSYSDDSLKKAAETKEWLERKINELEIPTGNPLLIELENSKISNCKYLDQERAKDLLVF